MNFINRIASFTVVSMTILSLSGCKEITASIISATSIDTMSIAKFDVEFLQDNKAIDVSSEITNYLWDMGDGQKLYGKSVFHSYEKSGTYPVTLTVFTAKGEAKSITKNVVVNNAASSPLTALMNIVVKSNDVLVPNAIILIDGKEYMTDEKGEVSIEAYQIGKPTLFHVEKEGYANQTYRVEDDTNQFKHVVIVHLNKIDDANLRGVDFNNKVVNYASIKNSSRLTVPFSIASKTPHSSLQNSDFYTITSDILNFDNPLDQNNFAGNTRSIDSEGKISKIIPIVSVSFSSSDNLQLPPNSNLKYSVNLPQDYPEKLKQLNQTLPTVAKQYYFDSKAGLWVYQGTAKIVSSTDATGKELLSINTTINQIGNWAWEIEEDQAIDANNIGLVQTDRYTPVTITGIEGTGSCTTINGLTACSVPQEVTKFIGYYTCANKNSPYSKTHVYSSKYGYPYEVCQ